MFQPYHPALIPNLTSSYGNLNFEPLCPKKLKYTIFLCYTLFVETSQNVLQFSFNTI